MHQWWLVLCTLFVVLGAQPQEACAASTSGTVTLAQAFEFDLFKPYTPRRLCMQSEGPVIWAHFWTDLTIALAYFSIPIALLLFVRRRKDLAFDWMFVCFAVFILACGLTHVVNIIALWRSMYQIDAVVKAVTALASIGTAIALWKLIPAALALPSPAQLRVANDKLASEIVDRKRAESELRSMQVELEQRVQSRTEGLRDSEARLGGIINSAMDAIITVDEAHDITMFNPAAERLFDCRADDAVGTPLARFIPAAIRNAREKGPVTARRTNGAEFPVEATISQITVAGEHLFTAIIRDVTERERAERDREQLLTSERAARTDAERASLLKDEFLTTLSHELRTPLTAILGWAQILRRRRTVPSAAVSPSSAVGAAPEKPQDFELGISTIERNARHQAQLIDDLLDMSGISAGRIRLDVQPTDLISVIDGAIDTVRPAADAKDIRVTKVLDPKATTVTGDPGRLRQVVWNLLTNAVKFTPKGGQISVTLRRVNSSIELSVSDSGIGIQPEFLPHVFERFRQADSSIRRRHGGLGLGLSIVRNLLEMHGSTIHAESEGEGQGTTFVVRFPLVAVQSEDPSLAQPTARADPNEQPRVGGESEGGAGVSLQGVKVLVVDDEEDARILVRRVLEDCGAIVSVAADADEGVEAVNTQRPDVIVSDIGMPIEDGYAFIRRVRALGAERGGQTPAAALTAFARSEDRRLALLAGFKAHVAKPIDPEELIAVVASLAGRT